jgi:hypothetical protein
LWKNKGINSENKSVFVENQWSFAENMGTLKKNAREMKKNAFGLGQFREMCFLCNRKRGTTDASNEHHSSKSKRCVSSVG